MRVYCGLASAGDRLTAAVVDDGGRVAALQQVPDTAAGYAEALTLLAERADTADPRCVPIACDAPDRVVPRLMVAAGRTACYVDSSTVESLAAAEPPDAADDARRAVAMARGLYAGALHATGQPPAAEFAPLRPALSAHGALTAARSSAVAALRQVLRELYPAALRAFPDPGSDTPLALLDALPDPSQVGRDQDESVVARLATAGYADAAEALAALRQAVTDTPVPQPPVAAVGATVRQAVAAVLACSTAADALIREVAERLSAEVTEPVSTPPVHARPQPDAELTAEWSTATTMPIDPFRPGVPEPSWTPPAPPRPVSGAPLTSRGRGPKLPSRPIRPVMAPAGEDTTLQLRGKRRAAERDELVPAEPVPEPDAATANEQTAERPTLPGEPEPPRLDFSTDFQPTVLLDDGEPTPPTLHPVQQNGSAPDGLAPADDPLTADDPLAPAGGASVTALSDRSHGRSRRAETASRSRRRSRSSEPSARTVSAGPPPVEESDGDSELLIFAAARSAWFAGEQAEMTWENLSDEGWRAAEAASRPAVGQNTESGLPRRVPQANLVPGSPLDEAAPAPIARDASQLAAQTAGYFRGWQRGRRSTGHEQPEQAVSSGSFSSARS
ncbi:hypothetical protein [Actinocatenispora sera]|uniref:Transposase IS110-like N-terminal domain-containing protein n=1 Tax=Actinocatenispora sera TaxID=390989 RepID=A0A810KSS3_9ACTN|nr:hypothetical protein [Actinocatenispora sera]BCJ25964.1 hypothetical protein Asera_00720 [Actinocatenispora sera]